MTTKAGLQALKWLKNRSGSGLFVRTRLGGRQFMAADEIAPVMPSTWNMLFADGFIVRDGKRQTISIIGAMVDLTGVRESE